MEKVMFKPFGPRGSKVRPIQKPLPDIGCKQSLVSLDLVKAMGLKLEDTTKQVEAINGNKINCAGWANVYIKYQGHIGRARLLVTHVLKNAVILSKLVLQRLKVLPGNFLHAKTKARMVKDNTKAQEVSETQAGLKASLGGVQGAGLVQGHELLN